MLNLIYKSRKEFDMKIGITGATGHLGRIVIQELKTRISSENIVALARTPEKASDMEVEVREFDYTKAEKLPGALHGIDNLLLISGSEVGQRFVQHQNVINAAKQAGVKWIVYTSILHADSSSISLAGEHLETEKLLEGSGIPNTILRNGWYTENYTGSVQNAIESGAFIGSAGDGKISLAARKDYAEAAVMVLTRQNEQGKTYELAGDQAYTLNDLAMEISRQTGENIPYRNLSENEYAEILKSFGIPKDIAYAIAGWDISASKGDLFDDSYQLSHLIGRSTTILSESVVEALVPIKKVMNQ